MPEICSIAPDIIQDAQTEAANFTIPYKSFQRATVGGVYAIDAAEAVEIDDALGFSLGPMGRVLGVCVTDVGGHLYDKPAIRMMAERRRKTTYQTSRPVIPMLPDAISQDILSLQDNTKRPVVTVRIPVDVHNCLARAHVTLNTADVQRVTYAAADQAIEQRSAPLAQLQSITDKLHQQRLAQSDELGGAQVQTLESERSTDSPAKRLVSEAMIAANAALAQFAVRQGIPCIFRSLVIPESYSTIANSTLQQYFGKPIARVAYTTYPVAHPILGHSAYLQATSPLRSLVDFVNQCNIVAFLEGREYPYAHDNVANIANSLNSQDYRSEAARPRALNNLVERITAGQVSTSQLATIFFSPDHTGQSELAKKKALGYLLENPHQARTIINSGVNSGRLVASVKRIVTGSTVVTLSGPTGHETTFEPHSSSNPTKADYMVRIVSRIAGLPVPTGLDINDYSEQRVMRNPQRYMGYLQRRHDLGYQATAQQQPNGTYLATAYVYIGGELQQWMASGDTSGEARSNAARQLIADMDYIRRPPLFVQSFESFMKLDRAFHPENCLRRVATYHRLPQPELMPARQEHVGHHYYTARMQSADYTRQLTAVECDPYDARQRAAYRLLRGVISDLRKMGRL